MNQRSKKPVIEETQQLSLFSEVSTEEVGVIDPVEKTESLRNDPNGCVK